MISYYLLRIIIALIDLLLAPSRVLPDAVIDPNIALAIAQVGGYLAALDAYLPVATLLIIMGVYLTVEAAIFAYKLIMWVIKKIPTIS